MKKIILILLFGVLLIPQCAFSNDNFIYAINVNREEVAGKNILLNIKSDYKTDIKHKIDETGREYFDIKDASLKENFVIQYNNANGVESVIAQQIGNKVRVYINGNDIENITVNFNNVENQPYPDKSAGYALGVFALIICAVFRAFKKKAKRLKAKAEYIQNSASKTVYNNLMEKKTSAKIYDNRNLTLNSLNELNKKRNLAQTSVQRKPAIQRMNVQQRQIRPAQKIAM